VKVSPPGSAWPLTDLFGTREVFQRMSTLACDRPDYGGFAAFDGPYAVQVVPLDPNTIASVIRSNR
jgi:hypothetical protein